MIDKINSISDENVLETMLNDCKNALSREQNEDRIKEIEKIIEAINNRMDFLRSNSNSVLGNDNSDNYRSSDEITNIDKINSISDENVLETMLNDFKNALSREQNEDRIKEIEKIIETINNRMDSLRNNANSFSFNTLGNDNSDNYGSGIDEITNMDTLNNMLDEKKEMYRNSFEDGKGNEELEDQIVRLNNRINTLKIDEINDINTLENMLNERKEAYKNSYVNGEVNKLLEEQILKLNSRINNLKNKETVQPKVEESMNQSIDPRENTRSKLYGNQPNSETQGMANRLYGLNGEVNSNKAESNRGTTSQDTRSKLYGNQPNSETQGMANRIYGLNGEVNSNNAESNRGTTSQDTRSKLYGNQPNSETQGMANRLYGLNGEVNSNNTEPNRGTTSQDTRSKLYGNQPNSETQGMANRLYGLNGEVNSNSTEPNRGTTSQDIRSKLYGNQPNSETQGMANRLYGLNGETNSNSPSTSIPNVDKEKSESILSKEEVPELPRTLEEILYSLEEGLNLKAKDVKANRKLTAKNIKVKESFFNRLKTGNWVYTVSRILPTLTSQIVLLYQKAASKFVKDSTKKKLAKLQSRVDKLSSSDIEVVLKEYKGRQVANLGVPEVVNEKLAKRVEDHVLDKAGDLKTKNKEIYLDLMESYVELNNINSKLESDSLSIVEVAELESKKKKLLSGKVDAIGLFRDNNSKANEMLSSGILGFREDIRANTIGKGKNIKGYMFAKKKDSNDKLRKQEAELSAKLQSALRSGSNEEALKAFVKGQQLLLDHTEVEKKLFVERSVGEREFNPFAEQLDYSNDTFIKDALVSLTVATNVVSAFSSISNSLNIDNINEYINNIGKDITGKSNEFAKGMEANVSDNTIGISGVDERFNSTVNSDGSVHMWDQGTEFYKINDPKSHEAINSDFNSYRELIDNANSGKLSGSDLLKEMSEISNASYGKYYDSCKALLPKLDEYIKLNDSVSLDSLKDSLENIVNNKDSVINMNGAMLEVVKNGEKLSEFNINDLSNIGGELKASLTASLSSLALSSKLCTELERKQARRGVESLDKFKDAVLATMESDSKVKQEENKEDNIKVVQDEQPKLNVNPELGGNKLTSDELKKFKNGILELQSEQNSKGNSR